MYKIIKQLTNLLTMDPNNIHIYYSNINGKEKFIINDGETEIVEESETSDFDLKLPGEVEKRTVTKDEVESRIYEIGELSTYCGEYIVRSSKAA